MRARPLLLWSTKTNRSDMRVVTWPLVLLLACLLATLAGAAPLPGGDDGPALDDAAAIAPAPPAADPCATSPAVSAVARVTHP